MVSAFRAAGRIVLDYPQAMLYHIGTRDMRTFEEIDVPGLKIKPWEYRDNMGAWIIRIGFGGFLIMGIGK